MPLSSLALETDARRKAYGYHKLTAPFSLEIRHKLRNAHELNSITEARGYHPHQRT